MKKIILFIWMALVALSCSTDVSMYDDTKLKDSISDLEARVAKLETLCDQMNSNISALQAVVVALQNKEYVESIKPLPDNQGYSFSFSSGRFVTVYNGKDGKNGADGKDGVVPAIGVRQDTDGVWYWTLNGDWLYADGKKVKAVGRDGADGKDGANGKNGVAPKLKIEEGMWYVSCDEGVSWEQLGKATGDDGTDAEILTVTEDGGYVHFKMADGTVITIAKRMPLTISFDSDDVAITVGGASRTIGYTLAGASEKVVVKTLTQDGWKAKVNQVSSLSGTIEITAPNPLVESEILVLVCDGGQTALAAINCVKATIAISQEKYEVEAAGGNIDVTAQTNTDFQVSIPADAKSWLSYVPTKSMAVKTLILSAAVNDNAFRRNAVVSLTDESGNVIRTFVVSQAGDMSGLVSIQCDVKGDLHSILEVYDKENIVKMKISGVLNDVDFLDIYYEMPALRYLDISDVNIDTLPKDSFKKSTNVTTIILPKTLVTIPDDCFLESKISGELVIPASCETIGESAFKACTALENVVFETGSKLKIIGGSYSGSYAYGAFSDCLNLKSIIIPASCETIGRSAFKNCSSLERVEFESGSNLKIIDGGSYSAKKYGYDDYYSYSYGAFSDCTALKTIIIPASCETVAEAAFKNCSSLETVVFESGSQLKSIRGSYYTYEDSYRRRCYLHYGAFSECAALKSITIPSSCSWVGQSAFFDCKSLEAVSFDSGSQLKSIYGHAFRNCAALESVIIPASCETIGESAFENCQSLTDLSFEVGAGLRSIGESAFSYCGLLHRIYMQNCSELASVGNRALYGNDQIYFLQIGAATPPKLGKDVFGSVGVYSVLKVPAGSESTYKNASGWSAFSSITAID